MVEATQSQIGSSQQFTTERRVIKSLKKFTDDKETQMLLASSAMYAHSRMDGKIMIFNTPNVQE
jgi:hypothetical protein